MKALVADRGQVTIPKPLRERLGIAPRTVLDFWEENGRLVAQKAFQADPVTEVLGCLVLHRDTDEILTEMRGDK